LVYSKDIIIVVRKEGRPKTRLVDEVEQGMGRMGIRDWKLKAQEKYEWTKSLEEAKSRKQL
jgi:hypothetical protein